MVVDKKALYPEFDNKAQRNAHASEHIFLCQLLASLDLSFCPWPRGAHAPCIYIPKLWAAAVTIVAVSGIVQNITDNVVPSSSERSDIN